MPEMMDVKKKVYVFLYPDVAAPTVADIEAGLVPKERLTGFYQLKERGWDVRISDSRWKGPFAGLRRKLKRFVHVPSMAMLKEWIPADVIVVKDDFSLALTLIAKLMRKKIVYLDSMFTIPKSRLRIKLIELNLRLADGIISFSSSQADLWAEFYKIDRKRFVSLNYCMDPGFYSLSENEKGQSDEVVSVGRDVGRDFRSLINAVKNKNVKLNLVTLPYLLPSDVERSENVSVNERLSYDQLFALYARSSVAVVPLVENVTYPSGIRAAMEAMLLGVPVICTYTPVMAEYFVDGEDILYVEPSSTSALWDAILKITESRELSQKLINNARTKMLSRYTVSSYGEDLENFLYRLQ